MDQAQRTMQRTVHLFGQTVVAVLGFAVAHMAGVQVLRE